MHTIFALHLVLLAASSAVYAQTSGATSSHASSPPVRRATEVTLDQQVTAKDLIGREVYDRQNDHIGEIVDVALGGVVPVELKHALAKNKDGYAPTQRDATDRQHQPEPTKPSDRERDDQPGKERVQAFATSTVFISVGGVLGVGADLVRAPLSALRYDRRHDHIVLDLSSEELRSVLKTAARRDRAPRTATIVYGVSR